MRPEVHTQNQNGSNYFVAEVPARVIRSELRSVPPVVGIIWDASGSGAARDHAREARDLPGIIRDAVSTRLVSDRHVGLLLSGGVDSTAVLSALPLVWSLPGSLAYPPLLWLALQPRPRPVLVACTILMSMGRDFLLRRCPVPFSGGVPWYPSLAHPALLERYLECLATHPLSIFFPGLPT